jgi:hypothetical protein
VLVTVAVVCLLVCLCVWGGGRERFCTSRTFFILSDPVLDKLKKPSTQAADAVEVRIVIVERIFVGKNAVVHHCRIPRVGVVSRCVAAGAARRVHDAAVGPCALGALDGRWLGVADGHSRCGRNSSVRASDLLLLLLGVAVADAQQ